MAKISIINRTSRPVDYSLVERIVELAALPPGKIDIHYHNSRLPKDEHGYCISSRLHKFVPDYKCLCRDLRDNWDCCIVLSQRAVDSQANHPAYFTYLLAHELGHAKICLSDLELHVMCCLVHDFIREASDNAVLLPHLLPHESACDAFGLLIATTIHSRDRVQHDLECLMQSPDHKDQERLQAMILMQPSDRIASLRHDIITFALPHKDRLIELWKQDFETHKGESWSCPGFVDTVALG